MHIKQLVSIALTALLIQACSSEPKTMDAFDHLERPPQLKITPHTDVSEVASITDEMQAHNGLSNKISLQGNKSAPVLKLSMDFDNTWQLLRKVLSHQKIAITDHDRDRGHYLVTFDTDTYRADEGFFSGLSDKVFTDSYGLRKYQLAVTNQNKYTHITAIDIGAVTTEADPDDAIEEIVDTHVKGPEDSALRLLTTLYKSLHDGFVEPEMRHGRGRH